MNLVERPRSPEWIGLGDELVGLIQTIVDERCGIIKNLYEKALEADEPQAYIFNAQCCSPIQMASQGARSVPDVHATGCDWTRESALWSTIGEALERYSAHCWAQFPLEKSSYSAIKSRSIPLEQLVFFSREQYALPRFRWVPLDHDVELSWYRGVNLATGSEVSIPANLIWIDFPLASKAQNFYPQVSTGLACGRNTSHVIHGGLREMIERDAFACHWCLAAEPPEVTLTEDMILQLSPGVRELLRNKNFDINIRWITTDIDVPAIFVLVRSRLHQGTTVGAACHPNAVQAIEKAVTEAVHGWRWLNDLRRDSTPVMDKESISDFKDHVRYYIDDTNFHNLKHYYNDKKVTLSDRYMQSTDNPDADIELMIARLADSGYCPYYVDITPDDISALGFCIGKVIVPGLQPLAAGYNNEHFDCKRLSVFARWAGIDPLGLNREPHPFP